MAPSTATAPARIHSDRTLAAAASPRLNLIAAKLHANGSGCFRVLGASMFPWIRSGDYVFVRRIPIEAASAGHVILYERDRRLFVHRVIRRVVSESTLLPSTLLITKGDALDAADTPVTAAEFLGRITRIHRGHRHLDLEFFGRILFGKFLALLSPASFLVYRPLRIVRHFLFD